jgi:hypothetical protein
MNTVFLGILLQIATLSGVTPEQAVEDNTFCECTNVMVVAADQASRPLVDAFSANLKASVLPDAPLGDVTGLGDDVIAQKASAYSIDTVIVIRSIPKRLGSHTLYSRYDVETKAWTLMQRIDEVGETNIVEAHLVSKTNVQAGVDAARAANAEEALTLNRGEFHRNRIIFGEVPWTFSKGVLDDPLNETEFYKTVGRADLADEHESLESKKTGLLVGGGVTTALGVGLSFVGLLGGGADGKMPQVAIGVSGLAAILAGTGAIIWGATVDTHPVSASDARGLGDKHNADLANTLGVKADADAKGN